MWVIIATEFSGKRRRLFYNKLDVSVWKGYCGYQDKFFWRRNEATNTAHPFPRQRRWLFSSWSDLKCWAGEIYDAEFTPRTTLNFVRCRGAELILRTEPHVERYRGATRCAIPGMPRARALELTSWCVRRLAHKRWGECLFAVAGGGYQLQHYAASSGNSRSGFSGRRYITKQATIANIIIGMLCGTSTPEAAAEVPMQGRFPTDPAINLWRMVLGVEEVGDKKVREVKDTFVY